MCPQNICNIQNFNTLGLDPGEVDIIVGGPPCQVFSRVGIGKMKSLGKDVGADPRNFLYKEFVRFIDYYRPIAFVMENVDYLIKRSSVISQIIQSLENAGKAQSCGCGYKVDRRVLDASRFGVPQKRKRLFIVGLRADIDSKIDFPVERSNEEIVTVCEAISDLPSLDPIVIPLKSKSSGPKQKDKEYDYKISPQSHYQELMRKNKKDGEGVLNHICRAHNGKDIEIFKMLPQDGRYDRDLPQEMMRYRADIFGDKYKRLHWDKPAWTLTAHMRKDGLAYIHPLQNRSISVREAARLQSFPDDFVFHAPMTRMFELVGNSVPPLLAQAVAESLIRRIKSHHRIP